MVFGLRVAIILLMLKTDIKAEIFRRTGTIYKEYFGKVFADNVRESLFVFSEISCVHKCLEKDYCGSMNYNHIPKQSIEGASINCELIDLQGEMTLKTLIERKGWKCIIFHKVCNYFLRYSVGVRLTLEYRNKFGKGLYSFQFNFYLILSQYKKLYFAIFLEIARD